MSAFLLFAHVRTWRRQKEDATLDDFDRRHYWNQYRRRMQASGIIAVLGILVPTGFFLVNWAKGPILFTIYVFGLLILSLWVIVLGVGDFVSTKTHGRIAMAKVREKRRALEAELAELKRGKRSNGHSAS